MRRLFPIIFLFVLSVSCGKDSDSHSPFIVPYDNVAEPIIVDGLLPVEALTFDVNITLINFTPEQEEKMLAAVEVVKKVVATEEFRTRIINHAYGGARTFVDNGGYTNGQIYQKILNGNEALIPERNNTMDVEVELYFAESTTIGYTYPRSGRIWVNTKFFDTYTPNKVAGNLVHEWLHKVGFVHALEYSASRNYSVPYAIGNMVKDLGAQFL